MKGFIKIWWHCLWRMHRGCRICYVKYPNSRKIYMCSCDPKFQEHIEWFKNK